MKGNLVSMNIINRIKFRDVIFLVISFILFTFFWVRAKGSFDYIAYETPEYSTDWIQLEDGMILSQEIVLLSESGNSTSAFQEEQDLTAISVRFGTNERLNNGVLSIALYEDDNRISTWEYQASRLIDNSYQEFHLNHPYSLREGHRYYYTISENYEGDNGVAVCYASDLEGGQLDEYTAEMTAGNTLIPSGRICYKQIYTGKHLYNAILVGGIIVWLTTMILVLWKLDERILMSALLIILSAIYFWLCPVGMAPDEDRHFYRAYEVSCGGLISQHMGETGEGGNVLPSALRQFQDENTAIDIADTTEFIYGNTALYSPVGYIPQAIGIGVASLFSDKVQTIFYGGRLGGWICSTILCIAALYLIPFGRKIIFIIMCFPMTLQEMICMAPDGVTTSLCLFLLAYILHLSYDKDCVIHRDIVILLISCLVLSQCKIIYVVLLLLLWMIPNEHFGNARRVAMVKGGVPVAAVICNVIWLVISSGFLVEFNVGVDSGAQVSYVLTHLWDYYQIAINTTIEMGQYYIRTMFGQTMGALNIIITDIPWVVLLILFVYESLTCRDVAAYTHKWDVPVMMVTFLLCSALIYTSIYVQWTALKNELILGIQGRYFIPIIALPALVAAYSVHDQELQAGNYEGYTTRGRYSYILLLMANGITILDMISYYIMDLVGIN